MVPEEWLYEVVKGDTVRSLSVRFGVPFDQIVRSNDLEDPNALKVGQTLIIER